MLGIVNLCDLLHLFRLGVVVSCHTISQWSMDRMLELHPLPSNDCDEDFHEQVYDCQRFSQQSDTPTNDAQSYVDRHVSHHICFELQGICEGE